MTLKQLRESLAKLAADMRALHKLTEDEDRGFTAEERDQWDKMTKDFETVEQRIKAAEQMQRLQDEPSDDDLPNLRTGTDEQEEREIRTAEEGRSTDEYQEAFDRFLRCDPNFPLQAEHRAILQRYEADMEIRAQGTGDSAGGYTIPEGFANRIVERLVAFSGLREAAGRANGPTLLRTASGNTIPFPNNDDTGNAGAIIAENTQVNEQDLVFGVRNLGAYMYTSNLVRVSLQLLQDEAVDLTGYLSRILGKRIGRAVSPHFAKGTGTAQPTGLVTAATDAQVNVSTAAGITHANLLDFEHGLDPAYRRTAQWVFNDTTLRAIKGLVDAQNRPLWLPNDASSIAQGGASASLLGYPYVIDQGLDNVGTGNRPIAFGDLSEFIIREVLGINLFRFNERYMDFLQIGWMAYARYDSNLVDTSAVVTDVGVA